MKFSSVQQADLSMLRALQPPDWPDIVPQFRSYIDWPGTEPVKMTLQGEIVAVGCAIRHIHTAWLAHIIVHPEHRGRGMGTAMTRALLGLPALHGVKTVSLVATTAGLYVYRKVGFITDLEYYFFRNGKIPQPRPDPAICSLDRGMEAAMIHLDRQATGEDRQALLREHQSRAVCFLDQGKLLGYYLPTFGEGLIVASQERAGWALARLRLRRRSVSVVPTSNVRALAMLESCGFEHYRTGIRMRLGDAINYRLQMIYNRVGGNLG